MKIRQVAKKILGGFPALDGVFRRKIWSRVHFPEIEMKILDRLPAKSIGVSVDVGCALGAYAWILERKSQHVVAFEPGKAHYDYLKLVSASTNIDLVNAAVGSCAGNVNLITPGSDTDALHSATVSVSNPIVNSAATVSHTVTQVVLDEYLSEEYLHGMSVDLVKVDVEGYELEVFKGATNTISKSFPIFVCEIEARHNSENSLVFELMRDYGYVCYFSRHGKFQVYDGSYGIEALQLKDDLEKRIGANLETNSLKNEYINNFVFQHPKSKLDLVK